IGALEGPALAALAEALGPEAARAVRVERSGMNDVFRSVVAAARGEAAARNAPIVPWALVAIGAAALALRQVAPPAAALAGLFALGGLCSAVPGAVARGAGEMERPVASSLAFSALAWGAGVGLACSALA
ncbi:MAG TPA: hypothetical protein VE964_09335, partial [Myxococcales bacterium]|nr:hypothetical protein [Myxococcales bacterium]